MGQHRFGDVVQYRAGKDTVNALVVQSNPQPDGEHLVLIYFDPAVASQSMAGSMIDKAITKVFAVPLVGTKTFGWRDLPTAGPAPKGFGQTAVDKLFPPKWKPSLSPVQPSTARPVASASGWKPSLRGN